MAAGGNAREAFRRFVEVFEVCKEIRSGLGQQSALGYLARTAHAAGAFDQALLLSEMSLDVGRQIDDRFGQSINLELQLHAWQSMQEAMPFLAVAVILRDTLAQCGAPERAAHYGTILEQIRPQLPEGAFRELEENAEAIRASAVAEARERFGKTGRDLFAPPGEDAVA